LIASGKMRIKPLITNRVSIEEAEKGFRACQRKEAIKALVLPA